MGFLPGPFGENIGAEGTGQRLFVNFRTTFRAENYRNIFPLRHFG